MAMSAIKKVEKGGCIFYYCENCDYYAKRIDVMQKHFLTQKHIGNQSAIKKVEKGGKGGTKNFYCANCSKTYLSNSGLWRHKKKCLNIKDSSNIIINQNINKNDISCNINKENKEVEYKQLMVNMMKENQELRSQISELIPKVGNNNTTHNNTLNQKFNINVFLNEQCKDALNMNDFIKSIEISLEQLDFTKKNGLVDGLSNAILENMNKLSLYERPMHCTDTKRETLYIKEEDKWTKDDNKEKIKDAIKKASSKNYNALQEWKVKNPDFTNDDLKQEYFSNVISIIGKTGEQIDTKIIKNLCKETYIKK
tara:strand:+ start:145 stop:1074 length:930 start_codon:yes stop_codon:yes gene_type:complete